MTDNALYVIGTGTDVGKTYVSALIIKKLLSLGEDAAYYKAAMSGDECDEFGKPIAVDARFIKQNSPTNQSEESMCPYVYAHAYSPHLAARAENNPIDSNVVLRGFRAVASKYPYTLIEGSGGIICPLRYDDSRKLFLTDVIKQIAAPCVLVANAGLGAINSVVLTAEYAALHGIEIGGIIFNGYRDDAICEDNVNMCAELTGLKVVAKIRRGDTRIDFDPRALFGKVEIR